MKFNLKKELPLFIISIIPLIIFLFFYKSLGAKIPSHWNINGEVDRYMSKSQSMYFYLVPIFTYFIFFFAPKIDPKKKLNHNDKKFFQLRVIMAIFFSLIFTYLIYAFKHPDINSTKYIFIILGGFFMAMGNYMKTVKPNYLIGIRTFWTLENEHVWRATHKVGGALMFLTGLLTIVLISSFNTETIMIYILIILILMVIIPVIYSFYYYKKLQNK